MALCENIMDLEVTFLHDFIFQHVAYQDGGVFMNWGAGSTSIIQCRRPFYGNNILFENVQSVMKQFFVKWNRGV